MFEHSVTIAIAIWIFGVTIALWIPQWLLWLRDCNY